MLQNVKKKFWRQICHVIFPPKYVKFYKQKTTFFWNDEIYIGAEFHVACIKNKKKMNKGERFRVTLCPPCIKYEKEGIIMFSSV